MLFAVKPIRIYGMPVLLSIFMLKLYLSQRYTKTTMASHFEETSPIDARKLWPSMFAVLGGSANPVYLFPLVLTVKRWKELGVDSIVCLGDSREQMESNAASNHMLNALIADGAQVLFFNSSLAPPHTLAQTCRLYISASPHLAVPDSSLLITSDGDLWPISLDNHLPRPGQLVFAYHTHCCGYTHYPWSLRWFRHYQISTVAMTRKLWREVMDVEAYSMSDGDALAKELYSQFNSKFIINGRPKPFVSRSWFADQIILSSQLGRWRGNNQEKFGEIPIVYPNERLFREWWPHNFTDIDISRYREVHMPTPLHEDIHWNETLPLMKILFSPVVFNNIVEFRNKIIELL